MAHVVVPLLVQVVGGNPVTTVAVLQCLNTRDVTILRQLHPVLINIVADVPWCDTATAIHDVRRWRAALPAAVGARVTKLRSLRNPALLVGLTSLNVEECDAVTNAVIQRLPSTLRRLVVRQCYKLTAAATFTHLSLLTSLDCSRTAVLNAGLETLPPLLQELYMDGHGYCTSSLPTPNFSHLRALRVLSWMSSASNDACTTLPPTLEKLIVACSITAMEDMSFAHLPRLRVFRAGLTSITDATVAALPVTVEELNVWGCDKLTPAVSFAHLRALRTLNICGTNIGTMSPARLPPSLSVASVDSTGTGSCVIA